ncbi:MAG: hypothetical protein WAU60_14410 [Candidatus Competibacter denitrificans]|jgi:hypothetical protein
MKATVNDPVRELKAVLAEHLPWQGARISFLDAMFDFSKGGKAIGQAEAA